MVSLKQQIKKATLNFDKLAENFGTTGRDLTIYLQKVAKASVDTPLNPRGFGSGLKGLQAQVAIAMSCGWNPLNYIRTIPQGRADKADFFLKDGRKVNVRGKNGKNRKTAQDSWDIGIYTGDKKSDIYLIVYYWDSHPNDFTQLGWISYDEIQKFFCAKDDIECFKRLCHYPPKDNFAYLSDSWILHCSDLLPPEDLLPLVAIPSVKSTGSQQQSLFHMIHDVKKVEYFNKSNELS